MIHVTRGNASHAELVIYIHLHPVRAGLVEDSAKHVFSGHRELLGKVRNPLLDVDDALLAFDTTTKSAGLNQFTPFREAVLHLRCQVP